MKIFNRSFSKKILLHIGLGLLLFWQALDLRLTNILRPFWDDEIHQNYEILRANGLFDLRQKIWDQYQPLLDYSLRKTLWVPLLGVDELSLRLPSLIYSLITVLVAYVGSLLVLERWKFSTRSAIGISFLLGLYVSHHVVEI